MAQTTTILTREIETSPDVWGEIEIEVEYYVSPFVKGVHTTRDGDPGWPDEGGEVEILSAVRKDTGEQIELLDAEVSAVEMEAAQDDGGDYEPDYYDRDYDDREYDRYEGGCDW
jgi:hypothetical protein